MMEEKVLVSSIFRKFNLKSTVKPSEIPLLAEVILRPKNGILVSEYRDYMFILLYISWYQIIKKLITYQVTVVWSLNNEVV